MKKNNKKSKAGASHGAEQRRSSKRLSRRSRWLLLVVGVVGLYTVIGFGIVPLVIRHVIVPKIGERINGTITLAEAWCNPYTFFIHLEGLEVRDSAGDMVASFRIFTANFELVRSVWELAWVMDHAQVEDPYALVHLRPDGSLNLSGFIKPAPPGSAPSKPLERIPRVIMRDMSVTGADFIIRDETLPEPFENNLRDFSFVLENLDTRPESNNPVRLSARTPLGETLEWQGKFRADPLSSQGTLTIGGLRLSKYMPYLSGRTQARIIEGEVFIELSYDLAPVRAERVALSTSRNFEVRGLKVVQPDGLTLDLGSFKAENFKANADTRSISIDHVLLDEASLFVRRDPEGVINLLNFLPVGTAELVEEVAIRLDPDAPEPAAPVGRIDPLSVPYPLEQIRLAVLGMLQDGLGPWTLNVEKVTIHNAATEFTDSMTRKKNTLAFSEMTIETGPTSTELRYAFPFTMTATLGEVAEFRMEGTMQPLDRQAEVKVSLSGLPLHRIAVYLPSDVPDPIPDTALTEGKASLEGTLRAAMDATNATALEWSGTITLEGLKAEPMEGGAALASIGTVEIGGDTKVDLNPDGAIAATWKGAIALRAAAMDAPVAGPVSLKLAEISTTGELDFSLSADGAVGAVYRGAADVSGLDVRAPERLEAEVTLARGTFGEIQFDESASLLRIGAVTLETPTLKAAMALLPPPVAEGETPPPAVEMVEGEVSRAISVGGYTVALDSLSISGASIEVRDDSSQPPAVLMLDQLSLEASPISTDGKTVSVVSLNSRLQGSGDLKFEGTLNPLDPKPQSTLDVQIRSLPLKPYDPYAGRFVGYLIDSGRATVMMPLTITDGQVKGTLDFALDQMYLGEKVPSTEAPDVPLKLGLDLLRDSNDRVAGKIPLSGDMNEPSFRISSLVWKAFSNLLFKAATAPFQVLGSLFGGGDKDISQIEFEPGSDALTIDALGTLDVLSKALSERQALTLSAMGRTTEADVPAMRAIILREQLALRVDKNKPPTVMTDSQLLDALEDVYRDTEGREALVAARREHKDPAALREALEKALVEKVEVPAERLADLASRRAAAAIRVLVQENGIPAERAEIAGSSEAKESKEDSKAGVVFDVR